jgi:hypothetical protein
VLPTKACVAGKNHFLSGKKTNKKDLASHLAYKVFFDRKGSLDGANRLLCQQLLSASACTTNHQGSNDAQDKQCSCQTPGNFFNDFGRTSSTKELVGLASAKSGVYATTFWILDQDNRDQQKTDQRNQYCEDNHDKIVRIIANAGAKKKLF